MRCPRCSHEDSSVIDSRSDGNTIRRRRECISCKNRFTTYERIEYAFPMVVKKDGRREEFNREKIRAGLIRACEKTPVAIDQIDRTVEVIESRINELHVKELASRSLGDFVMDELKNLDKVAYVRFASVYKEFSDLSQFIEMLHGLSPKQFAKKIGSKVPPTGKNKKK
jgi:transcriptional repressor NrdR